MARKGIISVPRLRKFVRQGAPWLLVGGFLLALLGASRVLEGMLDRSLAEQVEARRAEAVEETRMLVERRFRALFDDMLARAEEVAASPLVRQGLRAAYGRSDFSLLVPEQAQVIEYFDALPVQAQMAVELYTSDARLLAWTGVSVPLRTETDLTGVPPVVQFAVVDNDGKLRAVELWRPVREGEQELGAVRVVRVLQVDVDSETPYRMAYDVLDAWRLPGAAAARLVMDGEGVAAEPVRPPAGGEGVSGERIPLRGPDGTRLGLLDIMPPSAAALQAAQERRFDDLYAFWIVLLSGWLFAGLWSGYRAWKRGRLDAESRMRLREALGSFALVGLGWVGLRYVLLALDAPARWFPGSPLFDPNYLASAIGGGAVRSIGDLLVTTLFEICFAIAFLELASDFSFRSFRGKNASFRVVWRALVRRSERARPALFYGGVVASLGVITGVWYVNGRLTYHAVLDSTLDYFAWTGLTPEPAVLLVLSTLILSTVSTILLGVGVVWLGAWNLARIRPGVRLSGFLAALATAAVAVLVLFETVVGLKTYAPWWTTVLFYATATGMAVYGLLRGAEHVRILVLRGILMMLLLATGLLYPLVYKGMLMQRHQRMLAVVDKFADGEESDTRFLREEIVERARALTDLTALADGANENAIAESLLVGLPANLTDLYSLGVLLLDLEERSVATFATPGGEELDLKAAFGTMRQDFRPSTEPTVFFSRMGDPFDQVGIRYGALAPVGDSAQTGWITVVAAPRTVRLARQSPVVALEGADSYNTWRSQLSLAEFLDGRLVRSQGQHFERLILPENVQRALAVQSEYWDVEPVYGRLFETFYRRSADPRDRELDRAGGEPALGSVTAVRTRAIISYDHLYYLLRLIVSGLWIGLVFFVIGLVLRWRAGLLPPPQVSFAEKVQNAFLGVGIIAVVLMGVIGQDVVLRENQGAIQSRLERRLQRVEEALERAAAPGELPYQVLERVDIDSLSGDLSLDLNVYREGRLIASSRPAGQPGVAGEERLPIEAYEQIYRSGFRQAFVPVTDDALYTIGYKALVNEQARPELVIAVLTIPEQERIREERARTSAYLFGALLLLLLIIMATATALARTLSQPIRRLRDGLESVAAGTFQRPIPVESRDEFGELVRSFNVMQDQLAESRRKLGQQERELAWREMAKQVAHEIKNPLTPMKLSIQHLQRAYREVRDDPEGLKRFGLLFERITATLTEQIDTLARIANEFSTFARLPTRHIEELDLNIAVQEAVDLLREETQIDIDLRLSRDPLIVRADREELRRVYINLLKNAVQAVDDPDQGSITIQTWREEYSGDGAAAQALSSITDTGHGIPPDVREKIFQPNFSTKTSGMGLGLAIVKKSIEDMQGEIDFETWEEVGTTFTIALPLVGWPDPAAEGGNGRGSGEA